MDIITKEIVKGRLERLEWTDFSHIVDSLELASIAQYIWDDIITENIDFKELAYQYEEDDDWKQVAKDAEYESCGILCRFKINDIPCDPDDYSSIITSRMLGEGGPLSFIWNADINLEGTYLFTDEDHGYFRIDLYSDSSKYPMISNHTMSEMIKSVVA